MLHRQSCAELKTQPSGGPASGADSRTRGAFTLIELMIVIGIIAVLIAILLPMLGKVRESAYSLKCSANLHSIGEGIAAYVADYRGMLPASNFWRGLKITPTIQTPSTPIYGTIHWSSYLYTRQDINNGSDNIFRSQVGWDAFRCPSLENGGLPPANTFPGNSLLANESVITDPSTGLPVIDAQAPRLSYTVNEALCPRGFFVQGAIVTGSIIQRAYHFVRAGSVNNSAETILASELWGVQSVMEIDSLVNPGLGNYVSAARRPVSGFKSGLVGPENLWQLPLGGAYAFLFAMNKVSVSDLAPDPSVTEGPTSVPQTTLDWVGRNHGPRKLDVNGYDSRKSNFLYLDGHVESKSVLDTLNPVSQWGDQFYSLAGGSNIQ